MPRVLDVITIRPGQKFGSLEEQLVFLSEAFEAEGGAFIPLFNCAEEYHDTTQFRSRGVRAECLNLERFSWRSLWELRNRINELNIDIIQWNFVHPLLNPYLWAISAIAPGVRHWYMDRISRSGPAPSNQFSKRWCKGLLMRRYDRVICVSHYVEHLLQEQGCSAENLTSQLHFVNTDRFQPDAENRRVCRREQQAEDRFVFIAVGHLIGDKGMDVAIRALAQLPDPADLWIIGTGPEKDNLQRLARDLGVAHRVRFLGLQPQVQRFFQAADAFICPSLWAEAAGLVNIEAQACGLPILASRVGGIPEYLEDGVSGWLFERGSVAELAELALRLLRDPDLCQQMSQAARQLALKHFSPQARIPPLLDLYRTV